MEPRANSFGGTAKPRYFILPFLLGFIGVATWHNQQMLSTTHLNGSACATAGDLIESRWLVFIILAQLYVLSCMTYKIMICKSFTHSHTTVSSLPITFTTELVEFNQFEHWEWRRLIEGCWVGSISRWHSSLWSASAEWLFSWYGRWWFVRNNRTECYFVWQMGYNVGRLVYALTKGNVENGTRPSSDRTERSKCKATSSISTTTTKAR